MNIGERAGQEVVQVYVQDPRTLPFVPYWKRMLGFGRTPTLAPGAKATVEIPLLWCVMAPTLNSQEMADRTDSTRPRLY